mgnify:CR=1 FL=1
MENIFSVADKVVVITGGSGFLGRQYSDALEKAGAKVINWDIETGVDVSEAGSVANAAKGLKRIDILINNAAFNPQVEKKNKAQDNWSSYEKFPLATWRRELEINLTGQQIVVQAVAPRMMKQRKGSIIFIASDLALIGPQNSIYEPGRFKDIAYITSKAGALGLMRSWAAFLGSYGVRANALVPGGMYRNQPDKFVKKNSSLNMLRRMARAGEYNGPIMFLASEASSYMTGACLVVDGGRTAW